MSLKKRFLVTYFVGLLLPILIFAWIGTLESPEARAKEPGESAVQTIQGVKPRSVVEKTQLDQLARQLEADLAQNPERIHNTTYLSELKAKLLPYNAYVVLNKDTGKLVYSGDTPFWSFEKKQFWGDDKSYYLGHGLALLGIYLLIYNCLAYFIVRSITRPLKRLREATFEIGRLNFGYRIGADGHDEIAEVCHAFDQMAEQAEEAIQNMKKYEENRRELIANISHDLRTPLTAIRGSIDAINDGIADTPEKKERYWQIINSRIASLKTMIDELFLYSKLDMHQEPFQFETVQLDRFVEDVVEEWQMEHEPDAVRITIDQSANEDFAVLLDLEKMNRVLVNILGNSLKYAGVSPLLIHIAIEQQDQMVGLKISDNGIGVAPDKTDKLFERFYRADESRDSAVAGSGLGLAIAKQIVEAHGGAISANSSIHRGMAIHIELSRAGGQI